MKERQFYRCGKVVVSYICVYNVSTSLLLESFYNFFFFQLHTCHFFCNCNYLDVFPFSSKSVEYILRNLIRMDMKFWVINVQFLTVCP